MEQSSNACMFSVSQNGRKVCEQQMARGASVESSRDSLTTSGGPAGVAAGVAAGAAVAAAAAGFSASASGAAAAAAGAASASAGPDAGGGGGGAEPPDASFSFISFSRRLASSFS